ncbi:homeodomain superfamily [Elasticomyces elasticus]|nr:homeodomain superfamily [Elasticomyces elasticus]KAK5030019.1 homeodomain superfamily [Exophiala sideris]
MDPNASYTYPSNSEPPRDDRAVPVLGSLSTADHRHQPQQLPPFNEILSQQSDTVESGGGHSFHDSFLSSSQSREMTRRTYQTPQPPIPVRSEPQSPVHSHTGNNLEAFETMSARSIDSIPVYNPVAHFERRNSSWAPQYPDPGALPYNTEQRLSIQSHITFSPPRENTSLPSIRDIDRMGTQDSPYAPPTNGYPPSGTQAAPPNTHDTYLLGHERPPYFEPTNRHGYAYPPPNRPAPQADYARYAPSPYGYRPNAPYPSPYGPGDYLPSPTTSHNATSPPAAMDTDSRNRRRRGNLPRQITEVFRAWFYEHLDHPYPTEEDKQMFAERTGLTMAQISNWFINARRRQLPALRSARDRQSQNVATEYDQGHLHR